MKKNREMATARKFRNDYDEYSTFFVDSKGNRNFKRFAKKQANRAERHGKRHDIVESMMA